MFRISLLTFLNSLDSFLDIVIVADGITIFVSLVIISSVVLRRYFYLDIVLLLDEFHDLLCVLCRNQKIVHIGTDVFVVVTRFSQIDLDIPVKSCGIESNGS